MRNATLVAALLTLSAGSLQAQSDQCRHQADRHLSIDVAGARRLELEAGSGSMKIEGKPGTNRIVIRGKACASDRDLLDDIDLEHRRDGGSVVVRANVRDGNFNWRGNQYARLDIVVEVPVGMAALIEDGSGEIDVRGLGDVVINDGSGGIIARDLASASIEDGSGEIDLADIRGNVDIEDGSGEIDVRNVDGQVDIEDSSGEVTVRSARRHVRISDSSGGISVEDVAGDFTVDSDSSGGIRYSNVRGRVDIPDNKRSR